MERRGKGNIRAWKKEAGAAVIIGTLLVLFALFFNPPAQEEKTPVVLNGVVCGWSKDAVGVVDENLVFSLVDVNGGVVLTRAGFVCTGVDGTTVVGYDLNGRGLLITPGGEEELDFIPTDVERGLIVGVKDGNLVVMDENVTVYALSVSNPKIIGEKTIGAQGVVVFLDRKEAMFAPGWVFRHAGRQLLGGSVDGLLVADTHMNVPLVYTIRAECNTVTSIRPAFSGFFAEVNGTYYGMTGDCPGGVVMDGETLVCPGYVVYPGRKYFVQDLNGRVIITDDYREYCVPAEAVEHPAIIPVRVEQVRTA